MTAKCGKRTLGGSGRITMRDDIAARIAKDDTKDWKRIEVEFGDEVLEISVPPECEILHMKVMPPLANSREEISKALNNPIGAPRLGDHPIQGKAYQ
jgi:hypothetical protein